MPPAPSCARSIQEKITWLWQASGIIGMRFSPKIMIIHSKITIFHSRNLGLLSRISRIHSPAFLSLVCCCLVMAFAVRPSASAQSAAPHKTQNVIVVMLDGMRWQEVFRGVDPQLIKSTGPDALAGGKERAAQAEKAY